MRETTLAFVYIQYPQSKILKITPRTSSDPQPNNFNAHYGQYHAQDPLYQSSSASLFKSISTPSPFLIPKGKALRTDRAGRNLFLSWGKGIRVFFNITNEAENEGDLVQFDNSEIDDYKVLGEDMTGQDPVGVLTACSNMLLYYHEVQKNKGRIIF